MNSKVLLSIALATSLCGTAYAAKEEDQANPCYTMDVHITNVTGQTCVLANSGTPTYGYLEEGHLPPSKLETGETTNFKLTQRFGVSFGPDITLSYLCGDQMVTFESQQSASVAGWAGTATATIISVDDGLQLTPQKENPSWLWKTPGRIRWFIKSTGKS